MQELKSMVVSDTKSSHAVVGGKSVRACDNCVRKQARWYCAADDAFLCDSCDSSVHSANPLACRHERVRLKVSSSKKKNLLSFNNNSFFFNDELRAGAPSWHKGFTKKARTPRRKKSGKAGNIPTHLVPEQEVCSEEESEEQLLYRVPVFDVRDEKNYEDNNNNHNSLRFGSEITTQEMSDFLPSELDLAEFAADVESLLGKGFEDEAAFDIKGLGIFDCDGDRERECSLKIKDEDEDEEINGGNHHLLQFDDLGREAFELNFECEEDEEEEEGDIKAQNHQERIVAMDDSNKALLKLDYDRVMSAWDQKKSPWTTGDRPEFSSGDWWSDYCLGTSGAMHAYGDMVAMASGRAAGGSGGREARVSRYREKRRTRLFSKKIRYEVRKLNAEKRPRMKGRFVKRASFAASAANFPLLSK